MTPPSNFEFHKKLKKQNVEAQNGDFFLSFFFIFLTTKLGIILGEKKFIDFFNCKKLYITIFKFQNNKQQFHAKQRKTFKAWNVDCKKAFDNFTSSLVSNKKSLT